MGELAIVAGTVAHWAVTGALMARRPRHPVTVTLAVMTAAGVAGVLTPLGEWYGGVVWILTGPPMLAVLLVVFPDGPRGGGWRWVLRYQVAVLAVGVAVVVVWPRNDGGIVTAAAVVLLVSLLPIAMAAVVSLVRLYRRSTGARRARIGVVLGAGLAVISLYLVLVPLIGLLRHRVPLLEPLAEAWSLLVFTLPPVAIGLSVLMEPTRRRWTALTVAPLVLLAGAAATVVGATTAGMVSAVTGDEPRWPVVVAASVAVWAATALALELCRRGAALVPTTDDRTTAGLRSLADRLSAAPAPGEVPAVVAGAVGTTLELRGAAVDVRVGGGHERLATWGEPIGTEVVRPLEHAGEVVGRLVLVAHADGVPVDVSALDGLVPPVAAVVATARLTAELERAHGRLRRIRDDERTRLRGDMHDELSPSLAGLRLAVAAARDRLAAGDTTAADALLARVDAEAARAGTVVRNILDDLRPDDLAQLGLLAAVCERAAALSRPGAFEVDVEAPDPLPSLAPEVEVAVYRTATEAVANAARHSGGDHCSVRLVPDGTGLLLEVADDGTGLPEVRRDGLGLTSMSARAEAVGGRLEVGRGRSGGARVLARFPAETP